MPNSRRVFFTVAEVSGDQHAAGLIRSLKELDPTIVVEGIGGPRMAAAGAALRHETVGRAAMGWRGALRALEVARLLRETRAYYANGARPDLHVCVDSSAMNLPFARMAETLGVPTLYYVAPQLWASREGRIRKVRRDVDKVACILPFEESWYRARGVDATFVGHPLFDALPPAGERERIKMSWAPRFPDAPPVVGIIPGSRRGEVRANFPHLLDVAARVAAEFPAVRFVVPTTAAADPIVREMLATFEPAVPTWKDAPADEPPAPSPRTRGAGRGEGSARPAPAADARPAREPRSRSLSPAYGGEGDEAPAGGAGGGSDDGTGTRDTGVSGRIVDGNCDVGQTGGGGGGDGLDRLPPTPFADRFEIARDAFDELIPRCDLCLCKSGTSTLHVAAWNVPMIVVYRVSPVLWHGFGRWLINTKKIALVNILAGNTDLVPEYVPWYGTNAPVADAAIDLLRHPGKLADQRRRLAGLIATLDRPGAGRRAAEMAMAMMTGNGLLPPA